MPRLDGTIHVCLTVADLDRSTDWYCNVLDMVVIDDLAPEESGFRFRMLLQPRSFASIALGQAREPVTGPFDERRVGLHHVAFHVPELADLDGYSRRFDGLGLEHTGVQTSQYEPGFQIWLRDPDNVWVELYWIDREQFIDGLRQSYRARRGVFAGPRRPGRSSAEQGGGQVGTQLAG